MRGLKHVYTIEFKNVDKTMYRPILLKNISIQILQILIKKYKINTKNKLNKQDALCTSSIKTDIISKNS